MRPSMRNEKFRKTKINKAGDSGKGSGKNKQQYKYKAGNEEKEFKLAHNAHIAH